jgi:hypothetical protein
MFNIMNYNIYVLLLENNKYYIGKTIDSVDDIKKLVKKQSDYWLQINKPIDIIESIKDVNDIHLEKITLKYIKLYGLNNVMSRFNILAQKNYISQGETDEVNNKIDLFSDMNLNWSDKIDLITSEITSLENILESIQDINRVIIKTSYVNSINIHSILDKDVRYLMSRFDKMMMNKNYYYKIDSKLKDLFNTFYFSASSLDRSIYTYLLKLINNNIHKRYSLYMIIKNEILKYNLPLVENMHIIDLDKSYTDSLLCETTSRLYKLIKQKIVFLLEEKHRLYMSPGLELLPPAYEKNPCLS